MLTQKVTYEYDALNRRIRRKVDENGDGTWEVEQRFLYDTNVLDTSFDEVVLVIDETSNNEVTHRFMNGPFADQVLSVQEGDEIYFYLRDNQNSVTEVIQFEDDNSDGTKDQAVVRNQLKYDAHGKVTQTHTAYQPLQTYTGQILDDATGLMYYDARWFDPNVNQFINEDPIGFAAGDTNLRRYVGNSNPNAIDPTGLDRLEKVEFASGMVHYYWVVESRLFFGDQDRTHIGTVHPGHLGTVYHPRMEPHKGGSRGRPVDGFTYDPSHPLPKTYANAVEPDISGNRSFCLNAAGYDDGTTRAQSASLAKPLVLIMGATVIKELLLHFGGGKAISVVARPVRNVAGDFYDIAIKSKAGTETKRVSGAALRKAGQSIDDLVNGLKRLFGLNNKALKGLQGKVDDLAEAHLLPKFRKLDPNLEAGYTGSFSTGFVGNRNKDTFGEAINMNSYDIDYWIKSDVLHKKFGDNLKADVDFRRILSKTPGFEGLKPNKKGFSIKFLPSTGPCP